MIRLQPPTPIHHEQTLCYMPLDDLGVICVSGADANVFLQGLLTADLNALDARHATLSSLCNIKGRMISLFHLYKQNECYFLVLPQALLAKTRTILTRYVLRAKVHIDAAPEVACVGVCGGGLKHALAPWVDSLPATKNGIKHFSALSLCCVFHQPDTYLLLVAKNSENAILNALSTHAKRRTESHWQRLHIQHEQVIVSEALSDALLPQEVNLAQLGGLSYEKGCFLGQEVIARVHYKGKLKHRLQRVTLDTQGDVIKPLTPLFGEDKHRLGTVLNVAAISAARYEALVLLKGSETLR